MLDCMASSTFLAGSIHRGRYKILQHLDVSGLYRFRINLDAEHLLSSIHFDRHAAAARRRLNHGLLHLLLQHFVLLLGPATSVLAN